MSFLKQWNYGNWDLPNSQKPYINVAGKGVSLEPSGWETTLSREGFIFGSHQKIVIISDELAKKRKLPKSQICIIEILI